MGSCGEKPGGACGCTEVPSKDEGGGTERGHQRNELGGQPRLLTDCLVDADALTPRAHGAITGTGAQSRFRHASHREPFGTPPTHRDKQKAHTLPAYPPWPACRSLFPVVPALSTNLDQVGLPLARRVQNLGCAVPTSCLKWVLWRVSGLDSTRPTHHVHYTRCARLLSFFPQSVHVYRYIKECRK